MRHFKHLQPWQQAHVREWIRRAQEHQPDERDYERDDRLHDEYDAIGAFVERCAAGNVERPDPYPHLDREGSWPL